MLCGNRSAGQSFRRHGNTSGWFQRFAFAAACRELGKRCYSAIIRDYYLGLRFVLLEKEARLIWANAYLKSVGFQIMGLFEIREDRYILRFYEERT